MCSVDDDTIMPNVRSSPDRPDTSNTVNRLDRSTLVCPLKPLMEPVMYGLSASARYRLTWSPPARTPSCRSCNVGWTTPALVAVARVQAADALVDESLLERVEAVDAAYERVDHGDHVVGLVLDRVGSRVALQDDVHRVDARAGAGADLDDLSAERGREGEVFAFRVDDDHLVVTVEEHAGDLLFDGEGFAAAGR